MKKQIFKIFISLALVFAINFSSIGAVIYSPGTTEEGLTPLTDPALNPNTQAPAGSKIDSDTAKLISQIVVQPNNITNNETTYVASKVISPTAPSASITYVMPDNNIAPESQVAPVTQAQVPYATLFSEKLTKSKVPNISAPAYIVVNATSKHIYAYKDKDKQYEPAGLANLMTAYLATQFFDLDKVLTVKKSAVTGVDKDASIAALNAGDKITLYDALASMFVKGCVDSANVVAENVAGSIDEFVNLMNDTARSLGLTNTIFKNPSGINDESQLVSPLDMAIIMSKVCENKELVDLLSLTEHTLPKALWRDKLTLYTKNSQLVEGNSTYNPDLVCSRLGYNEKARYCVASMINHKGNNIVIILLKANGSQFSDTRKLVEVAKIACEEDIQSY